MRGGLGGGGGGGGKFDDCGEMAFELYIVGVCVAGG